MFDNLPVIVQSASAQLNGIGSLSGTLQIRNDISPSIRITMLQAMQPYRSVFWIFQDDVPIWAGPIVSWSPTTMIGGLLPFGAATMEAMFQYRLIAETIDFINEDINFIFRELGLYAVSKGNNSQIAGLNLAGEMLGDLASANYDGTLLQSVYDAWNTLVQTYDLEYTIMPSWADPSLGAKSLKLNLLLGAPLGRPYALTNMQFIYPSKSVIDYQWTIQNTNLANAIIATGTDATTAANVYTSTYPFGYDLADIASGSPLLEGTVTVPQPVGGLAEVDNYANVWVKTTSLPNQITPVLTMGPNTFPKIADIILGDECLFGATSPVHPAPAGQSGPGVIFAGRITGWSLYPPSQGNPETVQFNLGALTEIVLCRYRFRFSRRYRRCSVSSRLTSPCSKRR